jgi:predicted Zn-dependent protease
MIAIPFDRKIFENRKFSHESLARAIKDIVKNKSKFFGFLRVDKAEDTQYFLFFLKSTCYAAGVVSRSRPFSISIGDFFDQVLSGPQDRLTMSLYEVDPVLLKGVLVFVQKEPTIKAETRLFDLENILKKIRKDSSNAFVVLKDQDMMNFFFFKNGKAIVAYFADTDYEIDQTASIAENLLSYAYPTEQKVIEALIYRDIKTAQDEDSESFVAEDIIKTLHEPEKEIVLDKTDEEEQKLYLEFFVVEGSQAGENFHVTLPCVIGRKGSDVIIQDQKVSKKHARIKEISRKIIIEDLKSTNGTFVNNDRIIAQEIHSGDLISIGDTKMRVSFYWDTSEYREYTPQER